MADSVHVVCPHCDSVNRVPSDRPAAAAKCGQCHRPLFDGHPVGLTAERLRRHVARSGIPLLVDFWAAWCGPCRAMAPAFERAAREFEPKLRFAKVDVDAEPGLSAEFGIQSIPTLIAFQGGSVVDRRTGALDSRALAEWARRLAA